ncbi:MAG: nuclear transport factor 2 family protein, partial [Gemmatimonadaceae bacterium]|nr:nuclear transport factor 2 family protein [Gemmatimonadaceae bacterium]
MNADIGGRRSLRGRITRWTEALMLVMRRVCLLLLLALPICHTATADAQRPGLRPRDRAPSSVVRDYVAAFNAKDLDAMMRVVAREFVWMSVSGDSLTDVGRGVDAFRQLIAGYFRAVPSARSELRAIDATGPWVTTHERTRWDAAAADVAGQTSLVVYEVRDGLIRRAWFYPSL